MRHVLFALALTLAAAAVLPAATVSAAPVGDVNDDCIVNSTDLMIISSAYGYSYGSLRYKPRYDLNSDRRINVVDLQIAASHFGATC
ncbi:MAG TPA: dockerin type I domain-containing protein [Dehalococcoidia bacterium]|nr:dockerin type I domain-containing protein [Dehalococcoidia bacterium]